MSHCTQCGHLNIDPEPMVRDMPMGDWRAITIEDYGKDRGRRASVDISRRALWSDQDIMVQARGRASSAELAEQEYIRLFTTNHMPGWTLSVRDAQLISEVLAQAIEAIRE